jgi:hypothetical protein
MIPDETENTRAALIERLFVASIVCVCVCVCVCVFVDMLLPGPSRLAVFRCRDLKVGAISGQCLEPVYWGAWRPLWCPATHRTRVGSASLGMWI